MSKCEHEGAGILLMVTGQVRFDDARFSYIFKSCDCEKSSVMAVDLERAKQVHLRAFSFDAHSIIPPARVMLTASERNAVDY